MKTLTEQRAILATLKTAEVIKETPKFDTTTFLIPKWQTLAPTYGEALQIVLDKIAASRPFYNYRAGQLGPKYLREMEEKKAAFAKLKDEDGYYTVEAQMGTKYKGKSVKEVRTLFGKNEFGLGAFEVASILLTHPELLTKYEDLWIDCPGDEFSPDGDGEFSRAPYLYFDDGKLGFDTEHVGRADGHFGTASGFSPQVNLEA